MVVRVFRCLGPFLVETCALVEAGVGLEKLDKVMKSYGLPVGPITLADEVRVLFPFPRWWYLGSVGGGRRTVLSDL